MTAMAVAKKLGGKRVLRREITSELELAEAVRAGLPFQSRDSLLAELAGWAGSRTDLSVDESDRLARLARLVVRAEEALGDAEKARHWLTQPNRALGGQRPLTLLDSDAGALAVERVLGRIELGVYS